MLQNYRPDTNVQIRTGRPPLTLESFVREEIRKLDPTLPIYNVRILEAHISSAAMAQRLGGVFHSIFGMLALVLATVGIGSMLAYAVSQPSVPSVRVAHGRSVSRR